MGTHRLNDTALFQYTRRDARLTDLHGLTQQSSFLTRDNAWCNSGGSALYCHRPQWAEVPSENSLPKQKRGSPTYHFCSRFMGKRQSQDNAHLQRESGEVLSYYVPGRWRTRIFMKQFSWRPNPKMPEWPLKGKVFDNPRSKHEVRGSSLILYLPFLRATYFQCWVIIL